MPSFMNCNSSSKSLVDDRKRKRGREEGIAGILHEEGGRTRPEVLWGAGGYRKNLHPDFPRVYEGGLGGKGGAPTIFQVAKEERRS